MKHRAVRPVGESDISAGGPGDLSGRLLGRLSGHFPSRPGRLAFLLCCCALASLLAGCDFLMSADQLEKRAAAVLEKPYPGPAGQNADSGDADLLRRYLERVPNGHWRIEAYDRLIQIALGARQYTDLTGLLERLYREFIAAGQANQSVVYRACDLYLRHSPEGDHRWEVWNRMLRICLQDGVDKELGLQVLEAMGEEFADQPARLLQVLLRQAEEEEMLRRLPEAARTWARLLALPGATADEVADWSSRLGRVRFLQRDFSGAEETLMACATRLLPDPKAASCLLDLGALYRAQEKLEKAAEVIRRALDLQGISEEARGRAVFDLADIEYQLAHYDEARRLFESIRSTYPNPMVIETRLRMISERQKKK